MDTILLSIKGKQVTPEVLLDSVIDQDGTSLSDILEALRQEIQNIPEYTPSDSEDTPTSPSQTPLASSKYLCDVLEEGFYICDPLGNYVISFTDAFDTVNYGSTLYQILDLLKSDILEDINNNPDIPSIDDIKELFCDIDFEKPNLVKTIKRITNSGQFTTDVYLQNFYIYSVNNLDIELTLNSDKFICRDYLNINCNVPYTYKSIEYTKGNLAKLTLNFPGTHTQVNVLVEYAEAPDSEVAKVSIKIPSANLNPTITKSKHIFNSPATIVTITDDGGLSDFVLNWCRVNGYPYSGGRKIHGNDILNNKDNVTDVDTCWEFDDGCGGKRRFESSHAIMTPTDVWRDKISTFSQLLLEDAKIMQSLGDSFTWHDFGFYTQSKSLGNYFDIDTQLKFLADNGIYTWKCATEPTGAKIYSLHMIKDKRVALVDMQANGTCEFEGVTYGIQGVNNVNRWTSGTNVADFRNPDLYAIGRIFVNGDTESYADMYKNYFDQAVTKGEIQPFGYHGWGLSYVVQAMRSQLDLYPNVAQISMDHFWEYYNIYNNIVIDDVVGDGTYVSATLWIPHCLHELYGEITLNLDITDGGDIQTSDNVIGLSYALNSDKYTMNIAVCDKWITNRDFWKDLHEKFPSNTNITRDYNYVNNLLRQELRA